MALTTATTGAHCSGDVRTPARWGPACASSFHLVLPSSSQDVFNRAPATRDSRSRFLHRGPILCPDQRARLPQLARFGAASAVPHLAQHRQRRTRVRHHQSSSRRDPLSQMRMTKGTKPGRSGSSLRSTARRGAGDRAGATCQPALPSSPNKPTRGTQTRGATAGGEGVKRRGGGAYTRRGDWDVREKLSSFDEERGKGRTGDQRAGARSGVSVGVRGKGGEMQRGRTGGTRMGERLNCALP